MVSPCQVPAYPGRHHHHRRDVCAAVGARLRQTQRRHQDGRFTDTGGPPDRSHHGHPVENLIFLLGIILALMQQWPIFGFLQGAAQNWLLVSNILLIIMLTLIPTVFIPHNKKVEALLQTALAGERVTPELSAALNDKKNQRAHHAEEISVLVITALMALKPS